MAERDPVAALLRRARLRITDPAHWLQDGYAVTATGYRCGPRSQRARQWCALGALAAECPSGRRPVGHPRSLWSVAVMRLEQASGGVKASVVNDQQGHAAVLAMFDEAIRRK